MQVESSVDLQLHKFFPLSDNRAAYGVPGRERLRETTGPIFQSPKAGGGLTCFRDDPKTTRTAVSPTFHTHTPSGYEIQEIRVGELRNSGGSGNFWLSCDIKET